MASSRVVSTGGIFRVVMVALVTAGGCGHSNPGLTGSPNYAPEPPADSQQEPSRAEHALSAPARSMEPPPMPPPAAARYRGTASAGVTGDIAPQRMAPRTVSSASPGVAATTATAPDSIGNTAPQATTPGRKVHYTGHAKIMATKPDALLQQAATVATDAGGYVERLVGPQLTVRVPVERFRDVFDAILALGEVVERRIAAQDITEAYQAVALRLRVLEASRTRLIALLGKASREHEKLSILSQIKRLTEQVDQLQLQLQSLASMAAFSHITVYAVPRPPKLGQIAQQPVGVYQWLTQLSPFARSVATQSDRFELPVPEGMVATDPDAHWAARSPDGVALWAYQRNNMPHGDTEFWSAAVRNHIAPAYPDHQIYKIGDFAVIELRQRGRKPYRYLIGLRTQGDRLQVIEVYYPTEKHQDRYKSAIKKILNQITKTKGKTA